MGLDVCRDCGRILISSEIVFCNTCLEYEEDEWVEWDNEDIEFMKEFK